MIRIDASLIWFCSAYYNLKFFQVFQCLLFKFNKLFSRIFSYCIFSDYYKMSSCGVCCKAVSSSQLKLKCEECKKDFHGKCLNMSKADIECVTADSFVWRCKHCAAERRKSMRFESQVTEGVLTLEDIMNKLLEIEKNANKMEGSINTSYESLHEKIEDNTIAVKKQTEELDKCINVINDLLSENKMLKGKINDLENRLEEQEQYSRRNTIEVYGIPHEKNEDIVQVVKEVGKALDFEITTSMIDACHRMGGRPGPSNTTAGIIVKFVSRLDKEELLRRRRVKRNLSTRHMNLRVDQPVYINESLTPARRKLMAEARQVKREKNIRFLWVRNGKLFMRKEESAPVIHISCQADLTKV